MTNFNENQKTALIYAYGEQAVRTYRDLGVSLGLEDDEVEIQAIRTEVVGRISQWFDDMEAKHKREGAVEALREASELDHIGALAKVVLDYRANQIEMGKDV